MSMNLCKHFFRKFFNRSVDDFISWRERLGIISTDRHGSIGIFNSGGHARVLRAGVIRSQYFGLTLDFFNTIQKRLGRCDIDSVLSS